MKVNRSRLLIYPPFQLPLLFSISVLFISVSSILIYQLSQNYLELEQFGLSLGLSSEHGYFELLQKQLSFFRNAIIFFGSFGLLVFNIFFLKLSNRLIGPIRRLRSYFEELSVSSSGYKQGPSQDYQGTCDFSLSEKGKIQDIRDKNFASNLGSELEFREGDFFPELPSIINRVMKKLY